MKDPRKLLILDLDETIVFATKERLAYPEDFHTGTYFVYKRPGVDHFIQVGFDHFKVAIWTSSSFAYATEIISRLFPHSERLEFVWTRQRCTWKRDAELGSAYWVKDLKKVRRLGHSISDILVVDDSPKKLERSYGNYIRVSPFEGDPDDRELVKLEAYLRWLEKQPNVRVIDKRAWRNIQSSLLLKA